MPPAPRALKLRTVMMTDEMIAKLDEVARREDRSRGSAIRRAVESYVARCDSAAKPKREDKAS